MDPDADEPLLGAVVEIALDPFPLDVDRIEGPDARPAQVALERQALESEPDQSADGERQREELERRPLEDGEHGEGDGHEGDRADQQEAAERAQRPAHATTRVKRNRVTLVRVGPAAD